MNRTVSTLIVLASLLAWTALCVRLAWVAEDAFFTLRMAENLGSGRGLVWNPGARVMVASCPLWLLTLAGGIAVVDKPYTVAVVLSVGISVAMAVVLVRKVATGPLAAALALVVLGASRAVTDWTVSGMENPLIFLLLVAAVAAWRTERGAWLGVFGGLLVVVRLDLVLLVGPLVLAGLLRFRETRLRALLAFVAPVAAWLAFSVAWFGVPFPNPVYAKVQAVVPLAERLEAAGNYALASWRSDPLTPLVLVLGLVAALALRVRGAVPVVFGLLAYGGAAAWVGGDYMLGRLFGGPLVLVVAMLATTQVRRGVRAAGLAGGVLAVLAIGAGGWARWRGTSTHDELGASRFGELGVEDSRAQYVAKSGLWSATRRPGMDREYGFPEAETSVAVVASAGLRGFALGPEVTVVDLWGIGDPLLARMPPLGGHWRPGHFRRALPPGYVDSLRTGSNQVDDPDLAHLWDLLSLAHTAPLWSRDRWRAILELNTTDTWAASEGWSNPPPTEVTLAELPARFAWGGLRVRLGATCHARALRIVAPDRYAWMVSLLDHGRRVGQRQAVPGDPHATSSSAHELLLDDRSARKGFDELEITGQWQSDHDFRVDAIELPDSPLSPTRR